MVEISGFFIIGLFAEVLSGLFGIGGGLLIINVNLVGAFFIAVGLFIGAYFGAYLANVRLTRTLARMFAVLLILVALRIFFGR